jgi:methylthioribose-1-phosphate isomerase
VIRAAHEAGKGLRVYADETRPFLQGARLTAWELQQSGIDVTLICDNMAGSLMQSGSIDCCVVGSDRIAANGDVANKIGTYMVAVLAARHDVPFYVAAPLSTVDLETASGEAIPIEERPSREVTHVGETQIAPEGVPVRNIAFDVTPAELVTAIVTEAGVARPPYAESIPGFFAR